MYEEVCNSMACIIYDWLGGLMVNLPLKNVWCLPIMEQKIGIAVFSQNQNQINSP